MKNIKADSIKAPAGGGIVIYAAGREGARFEVKLAGETVWLSQKQISELFKTERSVITRHLGNIFHSKELAENSVCAFFAHTAKDGKVYNTAFYNLDAIISVGYRINSSRATQFRIWATGVLKRHLIEGYTINQKLLADQKYKLDALQKAIRLIQHTKASRALDYKEAAGLLDVIEITVMLSACWMTTTGKSSRFPIPPSAAGLN